LLSSAEKISPTHLPKVGERLRQLEQVGFVDETHAPGYFLNTGDFEALTVFDDFDELRSVEQ